MELLETAHTELFWRHAVLAGVGSRQMRSMGWQEGAGLGRQRQGRPEPLQATAREKRRGLGA
jgi:hypothetical protein